MQMARVVRILVHALLLSAAPQRAIAAMGWIIAPLRIVSISMVQVRSPLPLLGFLVLLVIACDANQKPAGASTASIPRTQFGAVDYGGSGVYDCLVPGGVCRFRCVCPVVCSRILFRYCIHLR
jgi:hypothetical protein